MEKVAIVTAASKGMGAASARRLHKDGFRLVLMARSEELKKIAEETKAVAFKGSVDSDQDLKGLVDLTIEKYGRVDVVVNNTGHAAKGALLELTDQDWKQGFDLLFMNVVRMSRHVAPHMVKSGGGSIINISSFAALEPSLDFPISSAIRSTLAAYVKLFSDNQATHGIRMNNLLPGFVDSYPVDGAVLGKIPSGREASVDEIANVVSFLASEDSSYINGENIKVDGGLSRAI